MSVFRAAALAGILLAAVATAPADAYQRPGATTRLSVGYDGKQASDPVDGVIGLSSWQTAISADGRYVAYSSTAVNLVPGDVNNASDVFVYDRVTRRNEIVSVSSSGQRTVGECGSATPSISADGRYVAFSSCAANLVQGDTNLASDVFVHDRATRRTERVSVKANGGQAMQPVDGHGSGAPSISPDGRYVAFGSAASDLVPGDTNGFTEVFLKDRAGGAIQRVAVSSAGEQGNNSTGGVSVSAGGKFVAFGGYASNLVPDDTNNAHDVFVRDVAKRKTERISLRSGGVQGNSGGASGVAAAGGRAISADGRYVMFSSNANSLIPNDSNAAFDIFVWDRATKRAQRISVGSPGHQGESSSNLGSLSLDGRYVAFGSAANNLVPGDTGTEASDTVFVGLRPGDGDVFLYDTRFMTTEMLSVAPDGTEAKGHCTTAGGLLAAESAESFGGAVSADGQYVAFQSCATNLVPGDTNGTRDEFLRYRGPHVGTAAVAAKGGSAVTVSGWSTFTGAVLASAADNPADAPADAVMNGGEIVGGQLLYRAEAQDLFLELDLSQIPALGVTLTGLTAPGDPRVVYGLRFVANGVTYEVRVQRAGVNSADPLNAAMGLFTCTEVACTEVAALRGGYGTTGEQIVVSLPLTVIGNGGTALAEGGVLSSLRAYTAFGTYYGGPAQLLDELVLSTKPSVAVPAKTVTVTAGRTTVRATLTDGSWSASLPASLFRGPTNVTVRSCLGAECRATTTQVRL